jgi:tetratricopeptide (TPR) repeat protein
MKAKIKSKNSTAQTPLSKAMAYHQNGKIEAAAEIYTQILKSNPNNFEALHLLGVIAGQKGNDENHAQDGAARGNFSGNLTDDFRPNRQHDEHGDAKARRDERPPGLHLERGLHHHDRHTPDECHTYQCEAGHPVRLHPLRLLRD